MAREMLAAKRLAAAQAEDEARRAQQQQTLAAFRQSLSFDSDVSFFACVLFALRQSSSIDSDVSCSAFTLFSECILPRSWCHWAPSILACPAVQQRSMASDT